MDRLNFLVIGDYSQDIFEIGDATRLSPEAPTTVFIPSQVKDNPGMAGNVYANLKSLLNPEDKIVYLWQSKPIEKRRFVDRNSGYILFRVDRNDYVEYPVTLRDVEDKLAEHNIKIEDLSAILIADYCKGFITHEFIIDLTAKTEGKVPVFLDSKKILSSWSSKVDYVKINKKEYDANLKIYNKPADFCKNLIVTLGEGGSIHVNSNTHVRVKKIEVRDVVGAGDTYFAAFSIAIARKKTINEAMDFANRAARVAVSKPRVVAVTSDEIE